MINFGFCISIVVIAQETLQNVFILIEELQRCCLLIPDSTYLSIFFGHYFVTSHDFVRRFYQFAIQ